MSPLDRRGTPHVTVITPSLPDRGEMLAECIDSVANQVPSYDGFPLVASHLIDIDHERTGVAATLNRLWPKVKTKWALVLADDDLLDPTCVRELLASAAWGTSYDNALDTRPYDIYYTYCRVVGRTGWNPNEPFDEERLRHFNTIPATAMIRRSLIEQLGGWREGPQGPGHEDWDFWLRALDAGARFKCIKKIRWTYRFHGRNLSTNGVSRA